MFSSYLGLIAAVASHGVSATAPQTRQQRGRGVCSAAGDTGPRTPDRPRTRDSPRDTGRSLAGGGRAAGRSAAGEAARSPERIRAPDSTTLG